MKPTNAVTTLLIKPTTIALPAVCLPLNLPASKPRWYPFPYAPREANLISPQKSINKITYGLIGQSHKNFF